MLLDAASAKALAVIVLVSTQGVNQLNPQLPLQATDRGDNWLIKGTPYTDRAEGLQNCFFHISFKKDTAEVISIGFEGRMILTDEERKHWAKSLSPAEFQKDFRPAHGIPAGR